MTALPEPHGPWPCVIDVEASGFGRGSYPIEVGFALADGATHCTLVRPADGWTHWDGSAERLHGITREALQQHGRPVDEVAALLNEHLAGATVFCNSWAHDYAWLAILFEAAGRRPAFRLRHLHELIDDEAGPAWDQACRELRQTLGLTRHRASSDARLLQLALARLRGGAA
jgi:hypothetical protein